MYQTLLNIVLCIALFALSSIDSGFTILGGFVLCMLIMQGLIYLYSKAEQLDKAGKVNETP